MFMLFINACATAQKAFNPERKNSSEEFLVEKKSPLALPPGFGELPTPKSNTPKEEINKDLEKLLLIKKNKGKKIDTINKNLDLEVSIIEQLNKN